MNCTDDRVCPSDRYLFGRSAEHRSPDGICAEVLRDHHDVAGAHELDLKIQKQHGVDYKAYWVSEAEGKIFCLVEAPNAEAAAIVHRDSHGLVADKLIEVVEGS